MYHLFDVLKRVVKI